MEIAKDSIKKQNVTLELSLAEVKQEVQSFLEKEENGSIGSSHLLDINGKNNFDINVINQNCVDLYNLTVKNNEKFDDVKFESLKRKINLDIANSANDEERKHLYMFVAYINNRATILKGNQELEKIKREINKD